MATVTVETISCSRDARGLVFEPIGAELLPGQKNVHAVLTEPGGIRGNHYHRHSDEIAVVVGPALVRLREDAQVRDLTVPDGDVHRFVIPAGIAHAFQNLGNKPMLVVAFSTTAFDRTNPDVFRLVLI